MKNGDGSYCNSLCWLRCTQKNIIFIEESIQQLDERMNDYLKEYQEELQLLQTMPRVSKISAASIIAEIGTNTDQFPTASHLSSWSGVLLAFLTILTNP
ncbi:transposase [Caldalkalibacillus mannanilyticus]|uniref:transposase n=1 Tax=Caldalkalibacillus mannanilyticus TaxID=1418 RepID=UPI000469A84F|nr:transposase [Caldalkalibacillus mannanilyticus]